MTDIFLYLALFVSILSFVFALITVKKSAKYKKESIHLSESVKIIQESSCYNISQFSQFSYLAECGHNEIKSCLVKENENNEKLSELVDNFLEFFTSSLEDIFKINIEFIEKYFKARNPNPPSITLKCLSNNKIIPLYSNIRDRAYLEYDPKQDTGIFSVINKGVFYLNNDIELSAKKGDYLNPNTEWNKLYNSALIIPISLMSNQLSQEFINRFNLNISEEAYRILFGFICIDHQSKNYFDLKLDTHIGYIFSEYLLLYLIIQKKYIDLSVTFQKAKSLIDGSAEQGHSPDRQ